MPAVSIVFDALEMLNDCGAAYRSASDKIKRLMNQAIFDRIYVISNEDIPLGIEGEYRPPFDTILAPAKQEASENTEQTQDIAKGRIQNSHGCGHFADNSTFMRSYSNFLRIKFRVTNFWWRRWELNPRPKPYCQGLYGCSLLFKLPLAERQQTAFRLR